MAHLNEGRLRQRLDGADALRSQESAHFEGCLECQARYESIKADAAVVGGAMAVAELKTDVGAAYERWKRVAPSQEVAFGWRWQMRSRGALVVGVAAIALIALTVTGMAKILPIFQPQRVEAVPVTTADMQALGELGNYGTLVWTQKPQPQVVLSAQEATQISGLSAPMVDKLPTEVSSTVTWAAAGPSSGVFTFSAQQASAAAAASGKTLPHLPVGMDGATLNVSLSGAIIEVFGDLKTGAAAQQFNAPQLVLAKSGVPTVTSTQVSVTQLEDYLLSLPGISPSLASAIRSLKDPTTTLPIPVPIDLASATTVQLHDVSGVLVGDNTGLGAGVVWIKSGSVYVVAGGFKQDAVLNIARGLT